MDLPGSWQALGILNQDSLAVTAIKIREDRLRRHLAKTGHRLAKTPSRSWLRQEYGPGYMVVDHNNVVREGCWHHPNEATLDQVKAFASNL